ncbi:unnamed protein product [Rotaria sp. Silwood1]|nr:unnamed protein product [Rotaria sp. Silwood1]CAF1485781.1 unnamed protein product [Rotaria sp. Silwood1]CAF3325270.1 unnamed protein product [Rotaria sp. Silwood1]CAF3680719.1 unnamed protein product [Rotaria sp. Silwood1]CAF4646379.1 unnamed protein product [Rotaria sp. Silwood1]
MAICIPPTSNNSLECVVCIWQSNLNPWSKSESLEWRHYSGVKNLLMEDAYKRNSPQVKLDNNHIVFDRNYQIPNIDRHKGRPIRGVERKREDKYLRRERFLGLSVSSGPCIAQLQDPEELAAEKFTHL